MPACSPRAHAGPCMPRSLHPIPFGVLVRVCPLYYTSDCSQRRGRHGRALTALARLEACAYWCVRPLLWTRRGGASGARLALCRSVR
eukprot:scaffold8366_cov121-Isochrysis_galbana.AAC.3